MTESAPGEAKSPGKSNVGHRATITVLGATALALASGASLATQYAIQPALGSVATDLRVSAAVTGQIVTAVMAGYLIGLVLLVPLADRFSPGRLVPIQLAGLAIVLGAAASAPGAGALIGAFGLIGVASTVAAQAVSVVGRFTPPAVRGSRVGIVLAGNSAGILLSRFIGGSLTSLLGWRGMLVCFAILLVATGLLCAFVLPRHQKQTENSGSYFATLRALPHLLRISRELRLAAGTGMLWFSAFNLVWVGISIALSEPPYGLGPTQIGLYSLAGVLGLVVTRWAGNLTDHHGARTVIISCLCAAAIGAAVLLIDIGNPILCVIGLAIFDAGCFGAQTANQVAVVSIDPSQSGHYSSVYLTLYYAAGAIGASLVTPILSLWGWSGVALVSVLLPAAGALIQLLSRRP